MPPNQGLPCSRDPQPPAAIPPNRLSSPTPLHPPAVPERLGHPLWPHPRPARQPQPHQGLVRPPAPPELRLLHRRRRHGWVAVGGWWGGRASGGVGGRCLCVLVPADGLRACLHLPVFGAIRCARSLLLPPTGRAAAPGAASFPMSMSIDSSGATPGVGQGIVFAFNPCREEYHFGFVGE